MNKELIEIILHKLELFEKFDHMSEAVIPLDDNPYSFHFQRGDGEIRVLLVMNNDQYKYSVSTEAYKVDGEKLIDSVEKVFSVYEAEKK